MKVMLLSFATLLIAGCSQIGGGDRYALVASGNGPIYRLDKSSGQVWIIQGTTQKLVTFEDDIVIPKKRIDEELQRRELKRNGAGS